MESASSAINREIRKGTEKRAIKLVIAARTFKYEDRLKYVDLPTLKYWRIGGGKIFTGKYDSTVTSWFTTRHVERKYDVRSHSIISISYKLRV